MTPDQLKTLIEAATPGPWIEDDGFIHSQPLSELRDKFVDLKMAGQVPDFERPNTVVAECSQDSDGFEENAALIVALVNKAPAILALWEAAQRIDEIMGPCGHTDHHGNCQAHFVERDCTAKALRAALAEMGK